MISYSTNYSNAPFGFESTRARSKPKVHADRRREAAHVMPHRLWEEEHVARRKDALDVFGVLREAMLLWQRQLASYRARAERVRVVCSLCCRVELWRLIERIQPKVLVAGDLAE